MDFVPFLWTITLAVLALCVGAAYGVLGMTPPLYSLARTFFIASAMLTGVVAVLFGITVPVAQSVRIFGTGVIGAIALIIGVETYLWVGSLQGPSKTGMVEVPSLLSLFMAEHKPEAGIMWQASADVTVLGQQIRLYYNLITDVEAGSKYLVFYIPQNKGDFNLMKYVADQSVGYIKDIEDAHWANMGRQGTPSTDTRKLPFNGRVVVYVANVFDSDQQKEIQDYFTQKKQNLQLRSLDYAVAVWQSVRLGEAKAPPVFEIKDGIPQLKN